jgi:hypothetical protein
MKYATFSIARPSKIYPNWEFRLKTSHLASLHGRVKAFLRKKELLERFGF